MTAQETKIVLDKYFEGITTLEEEQQLAVYFTSGKVEKEFLPYVSLFTCFDKERQMKAPAVAFDFRKTELMPVENSRLRRFLYMGVSAAACLLIIVAGYWFYKPASDSGFVMYVNGKRVYDKEQAVAFAVQELNKANAMYTKSQKPLLQSFKQIKQSITPLQQANDKLEKIDKQFMDINELLTNPKKQSKS